MSKVDQPAPPVPWFRAEAPSDPQPKTIPFEMRDKPWVEVMEWLSDETGIPVSCGVFLPCGTFTFIGPKDARYTHLQIIGILNRALLEQRLILIRHQHSFTI